MICLRAPQPLKYGQPLEYSRRRDMQKNDGVAGLLVPRDWRFHLQDAMRYTPMKATYNLSSDPLTAWLRRVPRRILEGCRILDNSQ